MKRIFTFIVLVKLFLVLFIANSYAAKGIAATYKVTMEKVELCTASTGVDDCENAVVIAKGPKEIDIAAVNAGAVAGSYGDATLLPLGTTYTHMRVTINRKFKVKSTATGIDTGESGDTDKCVTIATTDGMYVTSETADKYTHKPVWAEDGTLAEANLYMVGDNYTRCNNATCGSFTRGQNMEYGTAYAAAQQQHAEVENIDNHMLTYLLSTPYTVTLIPPTLDISFGTQEALSANEVNSLCQMWAEEPIVTITLK